MTDWVVARRTCRSGMVVRSACVHVYKSQGRAVQCTCAVFTDRCIDFFCHGVESVDRKNKHTNKQCRLDIRLVTSHEWRTRPSVGDPPIWVDLTVGW